MDTNTAAVIIAVIAAVSSITGTIIAAAIQFKQIPTLTTKVDSTVSLIKEVHNAVAEPSPTTVVDRNIDTSG
jgi:hypothetical protein